MVRISRVLLTLWILFFVIACGGEESSSSSSLDERSEPDTQEEVSVVNTAPVAQSQRVTTSEEESIDIRLEGSDREGEPLVFRVTYEPTNGTLSGVAPNLTYTPKSNYYGEDHFYFNVNDGVDDSREAEVTIEVLPINDPPVGESLHLFLSQESNKTFTLSAYDVESSELNYTIESPPSHGILSGTAPELIYTPAMGYVGEDYFRFSVSDGQLSSEIKEVNFTITPSSEVKVAIFGKLTYDLVPSTSNHDGLDYIHTEQVPIKGASVELIDAQGEVYQSTVSDANGSYRFTDLPSLTAFKVRVYAKMQQGGSPNWRVKVVDNTQGEALYGFEGELISTETHDSIRNLNAQSGWGGSEYTSTRVAAPFAIMDVIYQSMQNILEIDANTTFPPLVVNWSINNVPQSGSREDGQITTSYYADGNLYILGDANGDTDEYDDHVIAHEWGHYYEDKFSRTDSLGGMHTNGDHLDIRVAFGEGFGNAISAISLRDPIYFDTLGVRQAQGWSMDMESSSTFNAGWFSEFSVQHILYDLFDEGNESEDNLSLGFAPLHHVFVGRQKQTKAFTSIFSFIDALKEENNASAAQIDQVVAKEGIAPITDIYGTTRAILPDEAPYDRLVVGTTLNVCTTNLYGDQGSRNKLSNHKYLYFSVPENGNYRVRMERNNGTGSDPDFYLFETSSRFEFIGAAESPTSDLEEISVTLQGGDYLMDVTDWNTNPDACFDLHVEGI